MAYTTKWMQEREGSGWQSLIGEFGEEIAERIYGHANPRLHDYIEARSGSLSPAFLAQTRTWATAHPILGPLMGAGPSVAAPTSPEPTTTAKPPDPNVHAMYERVMRGLAPEAIEQLEAPREGDPLAVILRSEIAGLRPDQPASTLQRIQAGVEERFTKWGIEEPWWQQATPALSAAPAPSVAPSPPATPAPPGAPIDPGRGSMGFLLRSLGVGGPQANLSGVQSMENVIFLGMGWGFSRAEIETQLAQKPGGAGSPSDAATWLMRRYAEEYGGPPPTMTGEGGRRYPAYAWRQTPGGRQARARAEMAGYTPGQEYKPEEWEYPYVRRQGQAVPWSAEAITGVHPGIPGPEPGTYMSRRGATEAQQLKEAKDIQRVGVYPEMELRRGQESIMERMAFQMGPLSGRRERGSRVPMALIGEEWLPEGVMILPKDYYTEGTFRFSKDIFLPKAFEPEMVAEGTKWTKGKVQPFEGAAPLDLGLGRAWSSATMLSSSIAPGKKWSAKTQEWQEGKFLRMVFEVAATPEMMRLSSKTFGAKYMAPMGEAARIHGIKGHGISEIKDITMTPVMWWGHRPEEAAAALSEMREKPVTPEQLGQMRWSEVGRELTAYFREKIMPDIYQERPLEFDVHREALRMLPEGRFTTSAIEGQPEMARVTTDPVPMLVGEWSAMWRRGYGVKKPNLPFREMQMLEDVVETTGSQELLWDIQKQARPIKETYSELIAATLASKSKQHTWPLHTKPPAVIDPAEARGVVSRSQLRFEEKYGGKMPTDIPSGLSILNRMLMEEAESTWSHAISLGDAGVLASPKTAQFFGAQGTIEGAEVTGYVSSYASAIRAMAEGTPEEQAEAYERAITQQANIAGGRKVLRRAMQSSLPRALGDVLYPERALGAAEITVPEKSVLQAYNVKREEREAFIGRWKAGKITPTALVWGHPTTGREMFARQVPIIHPGVVAERGGMLGEETPFRASEMLAESIGRDFDEDYLWGLITGHLTGSGKTLGIKSPGIPMATAEWVRAQAQIVKDLGRSDLAPGAPLKKPPGITDEEWGKLGGLQRFQASVDPRYLRAVGTEEQFETQRALVHRQEAIGVRYNILDDIIATATGRGATREAEHLHLAVHGRGQTPALLTQQLEKMMNYLEAFTANKGGLYLRFAEPKEEGALGAPAGTGGKGAHGLQTGLMHAGLGAVTEGSITPEVFGALFYPEGRAEEGAKLARRWAKAPGGSGLRAELGSEWSKLDPEEWVRTSIMGTVGGAHMLRRAEAKEYSSRLSEETKDFLKPWQDRYAMMRAFRSKRGDRPLEERVRAAVALHPEQEAWFGSFGLTTEYQAGTLSSRSGRALVGEDGPEVVDLPAGTVVHPAESSESQDAVTARALGTGRMQRFAGGGEVLSEEDIWAGIDMDTLAAPPREDWEPAPRTASRATPTPSPPESPQAPQQRSMFPPRVSKEDFQRSLGLYKKNIDDWAAEIEKAGGIAVEQSVDLSAVTKQVLGWQKDIQRGMGYSWGGKEMQEVARQARGLAEPGAEGVVGPWQMLGEAETAQEQARFETRLTGIGALDTSMVELTERFENLSGPVGKLATQMEEYVTQWERTGVKPPGPDPSQLARVVASQMGQAAGAVGAVRGMGAVEEQMAAANQIGFRLGDVQRLQAQGAGLTNIGWIGMRAAGWAGGEAVGAAAQGAYYTPYLAERLSGMGMPGVGALGGVPGMAIGAAAGLAKWGAAATMPGDPAAQAATWRQMTAAQQAGPGVFGIEGAPTAEAGLGARQLGTWFFHQPTVRRLAEARGYEGEVGRWQAAGALMREEGRVAGIQPWLSTAGAGGMQTAEMLARQAAQPGMTAFQQMQMQEYVAPFAQGRPIAWAEWAQQGAPATGWEATAGFQARGMPAGMPTPPVEQVTYEGTTAWMQTGTQELWGLQEEQRELRIEQQELQQRQTRERLEERIEMTGATRAIQDLERTAARDFQRTQFGWRAEDITRQWERGGERLGWGEEDLERRRERAETGTMHQQQMLTYRYGMQQAQFGWAEQDLQRGFGRQQTQFGWQAEDLAFRGAQTTMQFGWQMEDIDESLRYATGRERRQLLRQRERAAVSFGTGMGRLETQEGRLEERRDWSREDFETEKQRLGQRRTWAQDLYNMQMEHLRRTKDWNQEDYEREKSRLAQRRNWLDEDYDREMERHGVRAEYWEQQIIFEDKLRELTQAAEDRELERQAVALAFATDYLTKQNEIQATMTRVQKNQAISMAAWSQFFEPNGVFRTAFMNAMLAVLATTSYSGTRHYDPYGTE